MVHKFQIRDGVQTCSPCGITKERALEAKPARGTIAGTVSGCSSAECPFKHPQPTSAEELQARYGHLMLWSH